MKISIITCTWNSECYLPESIASVLGQDYSDIEYIFVDGGSTDRTLDLIEAVKKPHLLIRNVRGGVSRAMNAGIEAATGDVIAHLHSDDYYLHSQALSRVAVCFRDPATRWVIGQALNDVAGQRVLSGAPHRTFTYGSLAAGRFYVPHPATFVLRSLLLEVGVFDESLKYAMDWDLWFRIAELSTPRILFEDLAAFRVHDGSLSSANAASKLEARREEFKVRMRYVHRAPLQALQYIGRYLVRTRHLRRQVEAGA